ncbi:amino acid ABC transporter ATP-binding protein [Actinomycetaceae bacterium MB13-C1-2]|nr:amino acid ABC transporter ATP-binding protein [Actinomycetaceae bacterium MB13-C1-2]
MTAVLSVDNLHKWFGDSHILKGVNLDVDQHEAVVLIGASGSGKSTLLKTVNLLERVDDGQILLAGEDITDPSIDADRIRGRIGVVFQNYNLFPHMSVLDNVTLALRKVKNIPKDEADKRGMELLERIGLADKAQTYPDRLSGGQQQRVAIARAIATDPELLLLDEVTSALDPMLVGEVLDLVRELKASGQAIVMATHEMGFARQVADRVAFLHEGELIEIGPPEQIFDSPMRPETREFLAKLPENVR